MNTLRDHDAVIGAWLDDGPETLPADTRQAIAVGIRSVPRRGPRFAWPSARLGWPTIDLRRGLVTLGSAAVVVLPAALALGIYVNRPAPGVGGVPSPSPTVAPSATALPRPSPSPGLSRFSSTVHGISIDYPSGWQTRVATEAWTGEPLSFDSPAADVIFDPTLGERLHLVLASRPSDQFSEDELTAPIIDWVCAGGSIAAGSWRVDGARAWAVTCPALATPADSTGEDYVFVYTDSRVYFIRLVASNDVPGLADTYNWDWLKPVLETVDLRPEDALEASASPRPSPSEGLSSPSEGLSRFTSTIHGISIDYPSGWQTRAATEAWNHDPVAFEAPGVDVIFDPRLQADLYFVLISEPLRGIPGGEWDDDMPESAGLCTEANGGGFGYAITLDGADGWVQSCGGSAADGYAVTVTTDTRGYIIYLHVREEPLLQATSDVEWFHAALQTVDLRPDDALDP